MKILLFGITRDIIGKPALEVKQKEAEALASVEQLKSFLLKQYPGLKNLASMAIAVNSEYATDHTVLNQNDEIALIPPVSGG